MFPNSIKAEQNVESPQQRCQVAGVKRNEGKGGREHYSYLFLRAMTCLIFQKKSLSKYICIFFLSEMNAAPSRSDFGGALKREEKRSLARFQKENTKEIQALHEECSSQNTELQVQVEWQVLCR